MGAWRHRAAVAVAVAGCGLTLVACDGTSVGDATPTPSASVEAEVKAPPEGAETASAGAEASAQATAAASSSPEASRWEPDAGLESQVAADPSVDEAIGAWAIGGAEASVASGAIDPAEADPDSYFAAHYARLGIEDGLTVSHEVSSTHAGAPLLVVDLVPVEGQGGDAQTIFVAFGDATAVQGVMTYDGGVDDQLRAQLLEIAAKVEVAG
ncbi:hypothetical protein [Demequina iriomotensis]|uniref:hypothetical protein n=1 Tax=Demequina iriomotensis TaxID=1536641 RepID=UPI000AC7D374|nr:hypothetical protein [Demequina iriomotensis]